MTQKRAIAGLAVLLLTSAAAVSAPSDVGPTFRSIGPLAFGPRGVLFAADNRGAVIYALELGERLSGKTPGAANVEGIDSKIAAMLGTDPRDIAIEDLAIEPGSRNAFVAVTRGKGEDARSVLLRVDGAGTIDVVPLGEVKYTQAAIPNAPESDPSSRRDPRAATVTDMAYVEGRLFIAGLSSEEFSSKLRSVRYPFDSVDTGTSVEIYHGAHGQWETRSPVYTFVPYDVNDEPYLIAGYLCTPLVKFSIAKLETGQKLVGTTIAELGNRNRPLDMIVYSKNGRDYILMSNTSRGVMKIPTDDFGSEGPITTHVPDGRTAGISYQTIASMRGIEQLDLYDDAHSMVIARTDAGALNLEKVALP